jgi:uncharacterized membrane protein
MYILMPFFVQIITLIIMIFIAGIAYELYDKFKNPHRKKKTTSINYNPNWWKNPHLYLGIILFIVIGSIAFLFSIFTVIGLGYLIMIFD